MGVRDNPFGPGLVRFLRELEVDNRKSWFEANKQRYEDEVREPALAFIRMMGPRLTGISPHLVANDRKVGGSLMRVHRDVRFSKDKRPYKTNLGIQFRHEEGKDVHAPGLYFHVDPKSVFLAAGMWHPAGDALARIRKAILADPKSWKRVREQKRFRDAWEIRGESLKRAPRGYPPDHPLVEDLKRTDHIAVVELTTKDVTRPDLIPFAAERYRRAKPYLSFLAKAVGLAF